MSFPEHYTRPLITAVGNEIWGVYAKADKPETPHSHQGGVLFARTQPLKVFSYPSQALLYDTDKVDATMRAVLLPVADMHYAIYEQDYQAAFIHIKTRRDDPVSEWSCSPSKIEREGGCEKIYLTEENGLTTRGKDVFLISEKALKIFNSHGMEVAKLPNLPYFVYNLKSEDPQTYKICTSSQKDPFYIVEA